MPKIVSFYDCNYDNISLVGGKSASLGELTRIININSADGFCLTTEFYDDLLRSNNLKHDIDELYSHIDKNISIPVLNEISKNIKSKIVNSTFTQEQEHEMLTFFLKKKHEPTELAVRSSAIAEDLPNASFAGQQDTYLNIRTFDELKKAVLKCFASLFNANAISYRLSNNIDYSQVKMAICVQQMIRSDLLCAGVAFSIDPESGYSKAIVINSAFGLGESVVGGLVTPDEFIVDKRVCNLYIGENGLHYDPIISKKMGKKDTKMVFNKESGGIKQVSTCEIEKTNYSLNTEQILKISETVLFLEKYYQEKNNNSHMGVDIEWAYDGINGRLYILQVRAETIHSLSSSTLSIKKYKLSGNKSNKILLASGVAVGEQISSGRIVYFNDINEIETKKFEKGDILLTDMTTPDWEPIMKIAGGIITNKGGRTCHAAIVAREHQINAVIGTGNGTELLKNEDTVTLSCAEGEEGRIYKGALKFEVISIKVDEAEKKDLSKIMFNVGSPENAFSSSLYPNNGVGLARMEFIINNHIKVHPLELLKKVMRDLAIL